MISKLIESFVTEMEKEETQQYINNIINPYFCKYKYYLCLNCFMIFIISCLILYNTLLLYRINKKINI